MAGDKPGDGSTNPFGDGKGGAAGGGAVAGNNFLTNPAGNPVKKGGGQPSSYGESRPQQAGSDPVNPNEVPAGGKDLKADPMPDTGNPIGTGSIAGGGGGKPFKGI